LPFSNKLMPLAMGIVPLSKVSYLLVKGKHFLNRYL
jgi:hypothetical protein